MIDAIPAPADLTEDAFFGGALLLRQPRSGHRIGTDGVLLAAACPGPAGDVADLGAGAGLVGLRAAQAVPSRRAHLFEKDPSVAALAAANAAANGLAARVRVVAADVLEKGFSGPESGFSEGFDAVLTNPPFGEAGRVRASPESYRAGAHVLHGGLDGWVRACLRLLKPGGDLVMIHRADRLADVLAALDRRFGAIALRFVHPHADRPAHRLLVRARKGSRAPLAVLPPLILHGAAGGFTPEAEAVHRGAADLPWIG